MKKIDHARSFSSPSPKPRHGRTTRAALALVGFVAVGVTVASVAARGGSGSQVQVPSTAADFFMPGTQPNPDAEAFTPIVGSINCTYCHGETCIRCHAPGAWLGGRSSTGTTAEFIVEDFDGINCHFCHRAVNPTLGAGSAVGYPGDPAQPDVPIISALAAQGLIPQGHGNARFVIDPADVRRGPFSDVPENLHGQDTRLITSPYHRSSEFCGTCHDVSNPLYSKNAKGEYVLNPLGAAHPTQEPHDMFPEQRTYSEWLHSSYPNGVLYADHRYGGNDADGVVSSCQDCHMPKVIAGGCRFYEFGEPWFERPDMPQHGFAGSNTWVIQAVRNQLGADEADAIGLTQDRVDEASARTVQMLQNATDMTVEQVGGQVKVRVTNESGHKVPSGYPEGRRMWLNVKFLNAKGQVVAERGSYNSKTAALSSADTKVYEAKHGITNAISKLTGLPAGINFHLALANKKFLDNRIPPRGFTNAAYQAIGAAPVGYSYADGQHWDDTLYAVPAGATQVSVTLYYQTTSKEYIEFLRNANVTDSNGQTAYDLWASTGKSAPVAMDSVVLNISTATPGDLNGDGSVNGQDLAILLSAWGGTGPADINGDGSVNGQDLAILLSNWG
ncbi:MAG: dockerin type I domain-containing protein [Planctomycetaceae bacterium]|nr:dockerin type I domain-containing protein [Planctomycetaceae bacterium]